MWASTTSLYGAQRMFQARKKIRYVSIRPGSTVVLAILLTCWALASTACGRQQQKSGEPQVAVTSAPAAEPAALPAQAAHDHPQAPEATHKPSHAHQDHDAKHGGAFFMALDEQHHLEGILVSPGTFRVFLYDDHSRPVSASEVGKAVAKVTWGAQDNAPVTVMKPSADGSVLESIAPTTVNFPLELTLVIRFPGAPANSQPELFTFPFAKFTDQQTKQKG
jgi:hypothetical protein